MLCKVKELDFKHAQEMCRACQIGTSKALVSPAHADLNLLSELVPSKNTSISLQYWTKSLMNCVSAVPETHTKISGANLGIQVLNCPCFWMKGFAKFPKELYISAPGSTSSQTQTSSSSELLDISPELASCQNTTCTTYPPGIIKAYLHKMASIFLKCYYYLHHMLLIWRV